MWTYQSTNELYHFGVPGMHWGNRKAISGLQSIGKKQAAGPFGQIGQSIGKTVTKKKNAAMTKTAIKVLEVNKETNESLIKSTQKTADHLRAKALKYTHKAEDNANKSEKYARKAEKEMIRYKAHQKLVNNFMKDNAKLDVKLSALNEGTLRPGIDFVTKTKLNLLSLDSTHYVDFNKGGSYSDISKLK